MSGLLDFPGSDSRSQVGPSAEGGGERTSAIVCAPPEESRLFVALLPPGNVRGVEVVSFYDDCASLESDVEQIRPAVVVLSPNSRNYSPALVNRLRRRPDFMAVVVGLVPPAGDFGFSAAPTRSACSSRLNPIPTADVTKADFFRKSRRSIPFDICPIPSYATAAHGRSRLTSCRMRLAIMTSSTI